MILTTGMAHQRKLIRQAVVTLLTNAATAAGARVDSTRVDSHKKGTLPAISVYTPSEDLNEDLSYLTAPREFTRDLQLEVVGFVAHSDAYPVAEAADDLAEQIEAAMDADRYLAGTAVDSIYQSTALQVLADDGRSDPLTGIVTLTYAVTYRTSPAPASAFPTDDFRTVAAEYRPVGTTDDNAVNDQFTVQEPPP